MSEQPDVRGDWMGRLVRVLVVFRGFVLVVTLISLPRSDRTPLVGIAAVIATALSYLPIRHWNRIARSVSRHPAYLGVEVLLGTLILAAAGAHSPFFYFTLGTAALAGVVYGRRGAIPFSILLIAAYELVALGGVSTRPELHDAQSVVFAPLLYPVAVLAGIAAREMVERGVQTETLLRERTEALGAERERLRVARELHDSLAKTVEGLAMTASTLARRCERNPAGAAELAHQLLADSKQAAAEARVLMSDLRPSAEPQLPLAAAIGRRARILTERAGVQLELDPAIDQVAAVQVSAPVQHELLRILGEAIANAVRHGHASTIATSLKCEGSDVLLSVADDGAGLPGEIEVEQLMAGGHFGIAGMQERARALGGELTVRGARNGGAVVSVRVPAAAANGERVELQSDRSGLRGRVKALVIGRPRQSTSARVRA